MHGQELMDAIDAMSSAQLQKFCQQGAEGDGDESAAWELRNLLFDALTNRLNYDVRDGETPEAEIITLLVEALDIPTTWQIIEGWTQFRFAITRLVGAHLNTKYKNRIYVHPSDNYEF